VLEWRQLINSAQASAEVKIIDANNLGAFYRFVNKRIGNRSSIGVVVDGNSRFVTDSAEKQICSTAICHLSVSQIMVFYLTVEMLIYSVSSKA